MLIELENTRAYRLIFDYLTDALGGRLVGVRVADRHTAEGFELFLIGPGDIVVGDRGYSRCRQWAYVLKLGGEVVVRVAVQQVPLLDEHGERLDVVAWLKEAASGTQSRVVAFEYEGQRFSGRLIASALSPQAAERAGQSPQEGQQTATQAQRGDPLSGGLAARLLFLAQPEVVGCSSSRALPGQVADRTGHQTHEASAQAGSTAC